MNEQFVDFDFGAGAVKSGTKVSESNNPEISLDSSYGKFSINTKARELMNAGKGSRLVMFDMVKSADGDQSKRFFIAKIDADVDGKPVGAVIGTSYSFNYSGIYNSILANDPKVVTPTPRELMDAGLLAGTIYNDEKGTRKFIALKKGTMRLESLGEKTFSLEHMGVEDPVTAEVFSLGQPLFVAHEPHAKGDIYTDYEALFSGADEEAVKDAEAADDDEVIEDDE